MIDVQEALAAAGISERPEIAIAAMDCLCRLSVDPDGRIVLPSGLQMHLDAGEGRPMRIVATKDQLFLWSEDAWKGLRRERFELLSRRLPSRARLNAAWLSS